MREVRQIYKAMQHAGINDVSSVVLGCLFLVLSCSAQAKLESLLSEHGRRAFGDEGEKVRHARQGSSQ